MLVERVCLLLMVVLVGDVFLGVFSRYVMHATFRWYDEVARLCFVWIIFLGAAVAVRRRLHFRMHLLVDALGPAARRHAGRLVTLTVIAFGAILVAGGIRIAPIAHRQDEVKQEADAFALMKAKGVQINEVKDIREFQERAAPVWQFLEGKVGKEFFDRVVADARATAK